MQDHRKLPRRRHSGDLKAQILAECAQPGASVASVAMSHGINANVVHKWRRQVGAKSAPAAVAAFVPVALPPQPPAAADIRIELHRGSATLHVCWPVTAAAECAAWMRELLK
jgi:transposase